MTDITDVDVVKKFYSLMRSAEDRGYEFNLSIASVRNMLRAKKCYFTGQQLNKNNKTIDRVDNTKGYIIGNVVACEARFNKRKNNLTPEEIVQLYKGVVLRRRGK